MRSRRSFSAFFICPHTLSRYYPLFYPLSRVVPFFLHGAPGPRPRHSTLPAFWRSRRTFSRWEACFVNSSCLPRASPRSAKYHEVIAGIVSGFSVNCFNVIIVLCPCRRGERASVCNGERPLALTLIYPDCFHPSSNSLDCIECILVLDPFPPRH